jgi:hypothetical protein
MKSSERHFFHYTERTYHYIIMHFFKKQKQSIIKAILALIAPSPFSTTLFLQSVFVEVLWDVYSELLANDDPLCCKQEIPSSLAFIISGAPPTVYTPKNPKNENLAENSCSLTPRQLPLEQHSSSSKGYSPNSSGSSIHTNQEPLLYWVLLYFVFVF